MDEQGQPQSTSGSWEEEKRAFARRALGEASRFMEIDNQIIGHFASIMASVARYADSHPERLFATPKGSDLGTAMPGDFAGGDWASDLVSMIREVVIKDKDFIMKLIAQLFAL